MGGEEKHPAARPEQIARPQIALLESENVIRRAVAMIGSKQLYPPKIKPGEAVPVTAGINARAADIAADPPATERSLLGVLQLFKPLSADDTAYLAAKRSLSVKPEPQTDLIRVSFRHSNPASAVEFTEAVVHSFIERYYQIYANSAAVTFFWDQQKRSDEAFQRASEAISKYSAANQVYRLDDQRRLLLEQRSSLMSALRITSGAIAEKESQADSIPNQLAQMKPIARVPQITGLVQGRAEEAAARGRKDTSIANLGSDPPLLLVKVYQDTVALLVKLHTELAGLHALEEHQKGSVKNLDQELDQLSAKEAEFERLRREVVQARDNADMFAKKAREEQLSQDLNARKLSTVQVLQGPTMPLKPIWPKPGLLLALGLVLTFAPTVGASVLFRIARPWRAA
jgi:uncharacterized protein involved in exopolysaccharide biosynthesis